MADDLNAFSLQFTSANDETRQLLIDDQKGFNAQIQDILAQKALLAREAEDQQRQIGKLEEAVKRNSDA